MDKAAIDVSDRQKKRLKLWQRMVCRMADRIETGKLTLRFPGGACYVVDRGSGPTAELYLKNFRPIYRMMTAGDLGFAASYMDGDWDSPDIDAMLTLGLENLKALQPGPAASFIWARIAYLRHRLFNANTRRGSRRNIAFHYDLGNEFYKLWLDETMTYSSALFTDPSATLAAAQREKYDRILRELAITADHTVLEIGCGWGGFAEYAISKTGCRVTGITLSKEQAEFARKRMEKAGFADRCEIRIEDYRDTAETYDRIVSIEMFEAVGEENWPTYFETVRKRLKPGGLAMIQTITIEEARFEDYRRNADFIQTYIFPGGMLPSVKSFCASAAAAGLKVSGQLDFGRDYARTLRAWDVDFVAAWEKVKTFGFDERFKRMWRYYLNYCAVGFDAGSIDVQQFRLAKENA